MLLEKIARMHDMISKSGYHAYVNYGGCGRMAVTIAHVLEKQYNIKAEMVFVSGGWCEDKKINIKNNKMYSSIDEFVKVADWQHIMVRFKYAGRVHYLDATNLIPASEITNHYEHVYRGSLTRQQLLNAVKNFTWNDTFDYNCSADYCRKMIRQSLKK